MSMTAPGCGKDHIMGRRVRKGSAQMRAEYERHTVAGAKWSRQTESTCQGEDTEKVQTDRAYAKVSTQKRLYS